MWLRFGAIPLCILVAGAVTWSIIPWFDIQRWATSSKMQWLARSEVFRPVIHGPSGQQMRSSELAEFTEAWLAPASYAAIAAIGAMLVFRGARSWYKMSQAKQAAHGCCGHAHGPSVDGMTKLTSTRDAVALIASIAMRPCTGALFVLVIAARFDAFAVGCLAVITMGLGTAAFNLTVATSGVAARRLAWCAGSTKLAGRLCRTACDWSHPDHRHQHKYVGALLGLMHLDCLKDVKS